MADIELVIKIPEKTVNEIKGNAMFAGTIPSEILWDVTSAIVNGTPLPKCHGRLIDADKLEPRDISPEAWYSPMWGFELVDIEDAPTIIEADGGDAE